MSDNNSIQIRVYSKQELRNLYGISKPTFRKWLKSVPDIDHEAIKNMQILYPKVIEKIFSHLGEPIREQGEIL